MTLTYEDVPRTADEVPMLLGFLEWQRETLMRKCAGLDAAQLRTRSVPPSKLSLLGLVRHMADVERWWFRVRFLHEPLPVRFSSDARPDDDFDDLESTDVDVVFAAWREECDVARRITAEHSLDERGDRPNGEPVSFRWILMHMIEEYSRHNGHADLLRERIDGATGY